MAKFTVRDILSPELRQKLRDLNKAVDEKIEKAIRDAGLKPGKYEQLVMKYDMEYRPKEKGKYPTSKSGGSVLLVIWRKRRLWTCWDPIYNLTFHETGDSREQVIMNFMNKFMIYTLQKRSKDENDFNKWNKKYGKRKKSNKDAI